MQVAPLRENIIGTQTTIFGEKHWGKGANSSITERQFWELWDGRCFLEQVIKPGDHRVVVWGPPTSSHVRYSWVWAPRRGPNHLE